MNKLIYILLALFLTSCRYADELNSLTGLEVKKAKLTEIQNENLSYENQKILRDYFVTSTRLISGLENDSRFSNYFHKKFFSYYKSDYCEKTLISKELYSHLKEKCTVSGFYICPDEFKNFEKLLSGFYSKLTELEKKEFSREVSCQKLMSEWGLK